MEAYNSFPSPTRSSKPYSNMSYIHSSSSDSFYSAPSSPANTPVASSDTDSCADEFEFKTTCPFSTNSLHHPPSMAFADELFRDNQLLPLRLPPRLQYRRPSPPPPPPPKPQGSSMLKLGLSAVLRSKNKEFDPFMAAVKRVRKEEAPRSRRPCHRRTRSCEPMKDGVVISVFHGAPKGKGGGVVEDEVGDRSVGVRELMKDDGLMLMAKNGDGFDAEMVDAEEMRSKSLKRYKQSRGVPKLLACFMFGPR